VTREHVHAESGDSDADDESETHVSQNT
jgi:hypothetical protein